MSNVVYVLQATEYERGYGQRPEGYLCFENMEKGRAFLNKENEEKLSYVPDTYIRFTEVGHKPADAHMVAKAKVGNFWINNLDELYNIEY